MVTKSPKFAILPSRPQAKCGTCRLWKITETGRIVIRKGLTNTNSQTDCVLLNFNKLQKSLYMFQNTQQNVKGGPQYSEFPYNGLESCPSSDVIFFKRTNSLSNF